ncbi:hypothetical protein E4U49_001385 [Claviceps purpurea]|nr:hypothetical protein E4U49_001385 [Claviceps purpurea]
MGWLPSIFGSNTESSGPLQKLDPRLREFLEKESAAKLPPDQAQASSASAPPSQSDQLHERSEAKKDQSTVPSASLYQDGRYAHIWKKYRPLSEVESETCSESEKLAGMLEGYGNRKKVLRDAALENCVMQEEDWYKCMKSGSWEDRMQFCTSQFRTFERCQTMQTRLLNALGYRSVQGRSEKVEDSIQMQADQLYGRMIDYEGAVKKAKEEGKPIPEFDSALPTASVSQEAPPDEVRKGWRNKIEKLPEEDRLLEELALGVEFRAQPEAAKNL